MGFFNNFYTGMKSLFGNLDTKESLQQVSAMLGSAPSYPDGKFRTLSNEAYAGNELVYSGISLLANSLSEAPIQILDQEGAPVPNHPTVNLLKRPNPMESSYDFLEKSTAYFYISGNLFWHKVRNEQGQVIELWALRPDRMRIKPDLENVVNSYIYEIDGKKSVIPFNDILHFKFIDPMNDLWGLSPLKAATHQIATDNEATDMTKSVLQNKGMPGGFIKTDEHMSDKMIRRLKEMWSQRYGGDKRGELGVLEGGLEFISPSYDMSQLTMSDLRMISAERILAVLGVPPFLLGLKDPSYSNAEEARRYFWQTTITNLQRRISAKIESDKDLNPNDNDVQFDNSEVASLFELRQTISEQNIKELKGTVINQDEARAVVGREPLEEELEPESEDEPPPPEPKKDEEEDSEKAHTHKCGCKECNTPPISTAIDRWILEDQLEEKSQEVHNLHHAIGRISLADRFFDRLEHWALKELKRQGLQLTSLIDDVTKALEFDEFSSVKAKIAELEFIWNRHIAETVDPIIRELMVSASEGAAKELAIDFTIEPLTIDDFIGNYKLKLSNSVSHDSAIRAQEIMKKAFKDGTSKAGIKRELKKLFKGPGAAARAERIARTETIRAANASARATYKAAGVTKIRWLAVNDACPYCQDLNGKIVGIEEPFLKQGEFYQPEAATRPLNTNYGVTENPPAHPNCQCTIVHEA